MKKPFLGLRTCLYKVGDLKAATKWYSEVFQTEPYFDEPFYVGFNIGGFELGLQTQDNDTAKTANIHTMWGVEDIEAVYAMLLEKGATSLEEPTSVGGPLMVASVKDPWDNVLGIIYNPVFKIEDTE